MVEEDARQDPIEPLRVEGWRAPQAMHELDVDQSPRRLRPRERQGVGIGIQADRDGVEMALLELDEQRARPAAQVEHAVDGRDPGLRSAAP